MAKRYWLVKSEPNVFSFRDLEKSPGRKTAWEGVRNYQARNFLRDEMKVGDGVLFYHSSCDPQVIAGTAVVVKEGYPDPTQFDPKSPYYDPESPRDAPRWFVVDVQFERAFPEPMTREVLKTLPGLEEMTLLKRGNRLSVMPVSAAEWRIITRQAGV